MPAAVHNLKLKELSASTLRLRIVDAAQCPVDVSDWVFEASLRQIESRGLIALLKVNLDNPSAGEISIAIPPRERSMAGWLLSAAPQCEELKPLCHGVATFAPSVSPKDTNNPETHRLILALANPVRVSVDSVDLAFWAASQAQKAATQTQTLADSHFNESDIHTSSDEKAVWNAKLSPADADARYGLAGTLPGQEVNGQSYSTSFYWRGTHAFCKSANFETGELENFSMLIDVDSRYISFLDSVIYSSGIASFNTLEANRFYCNGTINGSFSGDLTGNSTGTHTGDVVFADRLFNEFNLPGFRVNSAEQTVSFNGIRTAGGVAKTNPLTIRYAPENQKVDVANLEVKGQTVLNPSSENEEVLLATFKANDAARYELRLRQSDGALRLTLPGGGTSIFSCNSTGKMFALRGFDVKGDFTAQSATFSGDVTVNGDLSAPSGVITGYGVIAGLANIGGLNLTRGNDNRGENALILAGSIVAEKNIEARTGIYALPLGKKTALGADAYGLSVTADGGLQLWGTHFMQGSIWGEQGLKMVQNEVSLTSTDSAAIGFDFANTVDFRTMPNDGNGHGVYRFQCWHWTDDSHSAIEEGAVDVRKKAAMQPTDESLLNRAENDARYGRLAEANEWSGVQTIYAPDGKYGSNKIIQIRDASGEYPGYNICFRNGGSLEIFDESQDPTRHEPYFQIWRPGGNRTYACQNFCVKGTTELRKAVTLNSTSSLTARCPATFQGPVTFTQAPVVPNVSEPVLTNALNFHGGMGLSCMSQLFETKVNFDNWMTHAGSVSVTSNRYINLNLAFSKKQHPSLVGRVLFSALGATQGVYGGATGVVIPLVQNINGGDKSGWIKLSFEQFTNYNTANFAKNYTLEDEDAFVIYPVGNTSSLLFDITYRCDSAKTYYRTRYLRANTSFASGFEMVEQNAVINFSSNSWGTQVRAYFIFGDTVQKLTYIFVLVGNTLCKIAEMPYISFYEQSHYRDIQVSVGGLGEGCYGYVAFTEQTGLNGISNINTGSYVAPWLDIAKALSIDCVTERKEAVEFVPPVTEEASAE